MSKVISTRKHRIYGRDYRIDFVAENIETKQCCYEVYDSSNQFIGSAGDMKEVFEVIRDELAG